MKIQLLSVSFFLLCFFLVVNGSTVPDVCKKLTKTDPTLSYDFCVKTLEADPKSRNATLQELGLISIKLIKSHATRVKSQVEKMTHTNPKEKVALKNCLLVYDDAISNISEGYNAFASGDYATANVRLSAALTAPDDCEEGFETVPSQLLKSDKSYTRVVEIGLAFTVLF